MRKIFVLLFLSLSACGEKPQTVTPEPGRWYTSAQVAAGEPLYQQYCAVCHGADGSATAAWRTPDANGNYPPPPLDGTAHTWHHPLEVLDQTIVDGGAEFGGVMPGFGNVVDAAEREAIIAFVQHWWTDDIYQRWQAIDRRE